MTRVPINVSIRDKIVPISADDSLCDVLRRIGVDHIEAEVDPDESLLPIAGQKGPNSIRDERSVRYLKESLITEGITISAFLLATDFSAGDADRQVAWAARVIHAASQLGIPVVRIDPWTARHDLPPDLVRHNFVRCARQLLDRTAGVNVDIAMENHARVFNDPAILDQVLDEISDSRFGLTLDTGNLYWWGHPISRVYELIARYAGRVKHTHMKNIAYPAALRDTQREIGFEYKAYCCPLHEGDLDLRRIVTILREAGYRRDLCVEDESLFKAAEPDRLEILRREVAFLREAANEI